MVRSGRWNSWTTKWRPKVLELQHLRLFGLIKKVHFQNSNIFSDNDLIPWCHSCKYVQPNEPGVGCSYVQFNYVDGYYGLGDYPCGDLDVISIDQAEKWGCFLATPEVDIDENCAKTTLCLIKQEIRQENDTKDAAHIISSNFISTFFIFCLNFIL